jgi:hypothetical protein
MIVISRESRDLAMSDTLTRGWRFAKGGRKFQQRSKLKFLPRCTARGFARIADRKVREPRIYLATL